MPHKTVYPDWVQAFRSKGTTIRKVGNSYYLYGRKLDQTRDDGKRRYIDTYIGRITPEGVIKSEKKKISTAVVQVREYGYSEAVRRACPERWKKGQPQWADILDYVILTHSPESYITQEKNLSDLEWSLYHDYKLDLSHQTGSLSRVFKNAYGIPLGDLEALKTVYLVTVDGRQMLSEITDRHRRLLEQVHVTLEVN